MPNTGRDVFDFGAFRFTSRDRLLARDGVAVPLRPRSADVLLALLQRHGQVVSKDELFDLVWPDATVSESALTFQINRIREALGDGKSGGRYIETLPKRGYRFVAPVTVINEAAKARVVVPRDDPATGPDVVDERAPGAEASADALVESAAHRLEAGRRGDAVSQRRWRLIALGAAAATALVSLAILQWRQSRSDLLRPLWVARYTAITNDRTRLAPGLPLLADAAHIYFDTNGRLAAMDIATGAVRPVAALAGYLVFDVSATGSEFLASKLHDPGAERGLWVVPVNGPPRRLADLRVDGSAAWSPNHDRVAYAMERTLYVAGADGSGAKRIAAPNGDIFRIRWSPDGARLRFDVTFQADRTRRSAIWEASADGSGARTLFSEIRSPVVCCGAWTKDGRSFIFQVDTNENANLWAAAVPGLRDGPPDSPPTPLTSGPLSLAAPTVSADGRLFALGRRHDGELVRLNEGAREFTPYLNGLSAIYVSFSRNDVWMTYESYPDGALWRSRVDGGDKQRLTAPPMRVDGSALSPDGQWVVFRGRRDATSHMKNYLLPVAGGTPQPLVERDVEQGIASWSPDSLQLAYGDVPEVFGVPTGSERIHVYDRRTRTTTTLPGSEGLWTSRWSPDGRYIAALTIQGQALRLYDLTSRTWKALSIEHTGTPIWTRDGRALYFDKPGIEPRIQRLGVPDGPLETVFDLTGYPFAAYWWMGVSLDNRPILLRTPGGAQIYALELDSR
jgi:DNA-binding winged helix-turn-helix (wHTH) protein/Tol biopolymer transport system component